MIEVGLDVTVRRQCELLRVGRSSVYYEPQGTSSEQLEIMKRIDQMHLKWPFYGSRKITQTLIGEGQEVNRKRVQRLMRLMDISAIAPKPGTSRATAGHPIYPYLLRNLVRPGPAGRRGMEECDESMKLRLPSSRCETCPARGEPARVGSESWRRSR